MMENFQILKNMDLYGGKNDKSETCFTMDELKNMPYTSSNYIKTDSRDEFMKILNYNRETFLN
jgi:hypothetical protein